MLWPALFEHGLTAFGWQAVMLAYGVFVLAFILPATLFLKEPPKPRAGAGAASCVVGVGRAASASPASHPTWRRR